MNYSVLDRMTCDSDPAQPDGWSTPHESSVVHGGGCANQVQVACSGQAGYSRETVLLGCFALMLVLLALTAFVARMYHKQVHVLADDWFSKGEMAFRASDAAEAAKDYRNALVYSPSNPAFQLHLAQALTSARKDKEARSYLLNLLAESPGSGEINLELARLSARSSEKTASQDTLRYSYGAIYGVWSTNPIQMRWNAHRELCEYLLSHGTTDQAQSEITSLAQDVPTGDVVRQKEAAALLIRAKLWNRALEEYRAVLLTHRHDEEALGGAGSAAFQAGQYALALHYLDQLSPRERRDDQLSAFFDTAREVQSSNPLLTGLSNQERARRAANAVTRAQSLLKACSQPQASQSTRGAQAQPGSPSNDALAKLQSAYDQNSTAWNERALARNPAALDDAMNWVFQVEKTAAQSCSQAQNSTDRALLLIAQAERPEQ